VHGSKHDGCGDISYVLWMYDCAGKLSLSSDVNTSSVNSEELYENQSEYESVLEIVSYIGPVHSSYAQTLHDPCIVLKTDIRIHLTTSAPVIEAVSRHCNLDGHLQYEWVLFNERRMSEHLYLLYHC